MGSTANKQGRVIGENLCGGQSIFRGVLTSAVVRVMEQNVGKTGITAREAQELGMDYVSVVAVGLDKPHYMPEAEYITIKLLANPATRKVLGIQAVGKGDVAKRLDVAAAVLTLGGTIDDLSPST